MPERRVGYLRESNHCSVTREGGERGKRGNSLASTPLLSPLRARRLPLSLSPSHNSPTKTCATQGCPTLPFAHTLASHPSLRCNGHRGALITHCTATRNGALISLRCSSLQVEVTYRPICNKRIRALFLLCSNDEGLFTESDVNQLCATRC